MVVIGQAVGTKLKKSTVIPPTQRTQNPQDLELLLLRIPICQKESIEYPTEVGYVQLVATMFGCITHHTRESQDNVDFMTNRLGIMNAQHARNLERRKTSDTGHICLENADGLLSQRKWHLLEQVIILGSQECGEPPNRHRRRHTAIYLRTRKKILHHQSMNPLQEARTIHQFTHLPQM